MIPLQAICDYLKSILKPELFNDYCFNGLQVEGKEKVGHIATAVSASLETIEKAVEMGADCLLVHHGLFWKGDSYEVKGPKRKKLQLLLGNSLTLLAYHLPLDAHQEWGNNWKAAKDLGWSNLKPFGYFNGSFIGVQGTFEETSRDEFMKRLENYYSHPAHKVLGGKEKVSSAALISGGAYKSIPDTAGVVDCFITGNFDEPAWYLAHENQVNFYALGHSATEVIGPKALGAHLQEYFGIKHTFLDVYNPF